MNDITSYMLEQTKKILSIDSPTGFTAHAAEYVLGAYKKRTEHIRSKKYKEVPVLDRILIQESRPARFF